MMTNAQAALIAAASLPADPTTISYGGVSAVIGNATVLKQWLDGQDANS